MSRTPRKRFLLATLLVAAIVGAGCAADKPPPPIPDAGPQPKVLSDLSAISDVPIDPLQASDVPARGEGILSGEAAVSSGPRIFESDPGISREVGSEKNPGTVRLLNSKAAKFGNFSAAILDRVYAQLALAEKSEEISRTNLPADLKAVVITAILDRTGKLTELILEQHSGKAKIDRMMIDVCKKGVWYENPPPAALSGDGTYKLTFRMKLKNFAASDGRHWSFITDLGLGLG